MATPPRPGAREPTSRDDSGERVPDDRLGTPAERRSKAAAVTRAARARAALRKRNVFGRVVD